MNEPRQLALFDYGTLDHDTRSFLQTKTAEIRILVKQTAQGVIDIGQRLLEVRDRLEHGQFLHWIETEFGWKKSTAYNLINVASNFQQVGNFDFSPKVLYLLAAPSVPEEARQEALSLAESGERITHQKAQEIIAKHKAEAEAAKREAASKQQTITTLEDQIKALENERTRLRAEHNRAILTKQADDACIIRQQEFGEEKERQIEELNRQIEKLKAKAAQPHVIEKEVEKVIEKVIEKEVEKVVEVVKAPDDYEQLKTEVATLKEKLKTTRQKSGEELSQYQESVANLTKRLAQKEEALASFDVEQKQMKALRKLNESHHSFREAVNLLTSQHLGNPRLKETINAYLQDFIKDFNTFSEQVNTIDADLMEVDYAESCTGKDT